MTSLRLPKLYYDDAAPVLVAPNGERVQHATAGELFHQAYREPSRFGITVPGHFTVGDAIRLLTGFRTTLKESAWALDHNGALALHADKMAALRPAYLSFRSTWYYRRDVIAAHLPRRRCETCGRAVSVDHGPLAPHPCTQLCQRIRATSAFSQLHDRESRKFWEHLVAPSCSPECHNTVALRYWRITLDLKEMREWTISGRTLLRELQEQLPGSVAAQARRRRASQSQSVELRPQTTSGT